MSESKLTGPQQVIAGDAISALLEERPITFREAWVAANKAIGFYAEDQSTPCYRFADGLLQKLRRAGKVTVERQGRNWIWKASS